MTTTRKPIATNEQIHDLAHAVAQQAVALDAMAATASSYYAKVRLLSDNLDTLKAWTADREPIPVSPGRKVATQAVAAVEAKRSDCTIPCDGTGWTGDPRERCTTHYEL